MEISERSSSDDTGKKLILYTIQYDWLLLDILILIKYYKFTFLIEIS
jgi:hypothetical protein